MLPNKTEEVRECLRRAEECARQAKAQFDTKFRQAFLDLEQRWLRLARSYEFSERLDIASDSLASDSLDPRQLTARC
jgi:hypothetical protein